MDELLTIGGFARLCGLSVGALRHYDEVGLLPPATVDPDTGYRRYGRDQLGRARAIGRLRELDVPLERIEAVLGGDLEPLRAERARAQQRLSRLQRIASGLQRLIDGTEDLMAPRERTPVDPEVERRLAIDLFNHVWTLLDRADRTADEDDEMIHGAHASAYHWSVVGEPVNRARGEWQISRVYAVLGRAEPSVAHARRCLELCEEHGIGDFDLAYAYEALARAHAVGGNGDEAARFRAQAEEAAEAVREEEDRELLRRDLATL